MTNPLTKTEAALLYGYGYRLVDKECEWDIIQVGGGGLTIVRVSGQMPRFISFSSIGTDYHVLVHPLSRLTTEIEGIGVPIVELAAISFPKEDFTLIKDVAGCFDFDFGYINDDFVSVGYDYKSVPVKNIRGLFAQMYAWHFDCCNFLERGIGKEITV